MNALLPRDRIDMLRAEYAAALIVALEARFAKTSELDLELADRIEAVLFEAPKLKEIRLSGDDNSALLGHV